MGGEYSTGTNCALNQEGSIVTINSIPDMLYFIEVVSYSSTAGFDQNEAGTNGFVRVRSSVFG
jgi:hypothetical protein